MEPTRQTFWTGEGSFWQNVWLPPQESTTAHEIDALFHFILWTSALLTLIVAVAMVYFVWKYRRRSAADRPRYVEESKLLELSWIVIPTLLVSVVFFWGFRAYVGTSIPPVGAYEINVKGQKWFWTFEYDNGLITQDEFYVPAGQPIKLVMTSQDVLHSFYVPEFRIKHDVIPNRYSTVWFDAPEEGVYQVLCTEYCGTDHSNMGAKIHVVGQGEWARFLREGPPGEAQEPTPEYGETLYTSKSCNTCHSIDGSDGTGPTWLGRYGQPVQFDDGTSGVVDEAYIAESILYPGNKVAAGYANQMPSYQGLLNDTQIDALTAYIQQLNGAEITVGLDSTAAGPEGADAGPEATPGEGQGDPSQPQGLTGE